ncbi:MAG: hypothetical protein OEL75_01660, partial [Kiritimatiellaceae bacterium]|nr:hypothetical protein [Kiritimatiellaceae bacterium]
LEELSLKRTTCTDQVRILQNETGELSRQLTDKNARLEMIAADREEGFPSGARHLLETENELIIGPLAEQFTANAGYETALQAVLRPWMDALVVKDRAGARNVLTLLSTGDHGAVRLLAADTPAPVAVTTDAPSLLDQVSFASPIAPLAAQLLTNVFVADSLQSIPLDPPTGALFVTKTGELLSASGAAELWRPEQGEINPLSRHHMREQLQGEIDVLTKKLNDHQARMELLQNEQNSTAEVLEYTRTELDARRRSLAVQEGEAQVIARELETARERVEIVTFEFNALLEEKGEGEDRRSSVAREGAEAREKLVQTRQQISTQTETLNTLEEKRAEVLSATSECRVQFSQREQQLESLLSRRQPIEARLKELEDVIQERTQGINSYQQRIEQLKQTSAEAEGQIDGLREAVTAADARLAEARQIRETKTVALSEREQSMRVLQQKLEILQGQKTTFEVELAEQRMRYQNAADHLTSTWQVTLEDLADEPDPEWEEERPTMEELETQVAEYRAKLDSMGPVNLVAIEEHAELEERFAFLNQQEDDLNKAKVQLLQMIKKINETTTELFKDTFDKVNANFGEMFKNLFGGGSAKLVLVDETDVLESGIEIIARPPGKKLQTISLLSGGERTMTAVALLFSLFKVKPSPFCVLDELDAALDEANVNRFVAMVKTFLQQSQFILITHSRQTIAAADVIYGVTMPNRGVSRVMSMKFADYQDE